MAAALRTRGPALEIELDPKVPPVFGVMFVSCRTKMSWLMSMSSSSAARRSRPVVAPWPISTRPVLIDAVLSAWIATNESTCPRSGGPFEENGLSTACAAFAPSAPAALKPTTSAPPPRISERRENSLLGNQAGHHAPPFAITAAAFWIAVRILGYVPQRHRCPFIAVRIWSSDGFFVVASRSAAWIIIPFWQ